MIYILDMHETMKRLYEVAASRFDIHGQSDLANRLNQSPQTLNNWEARGMSKAGILLASGQLGINAIWLETGEGNATVSKIHPLDTYKEVFNNSDKGVQAMIINFLKAVEQSQRGIDGESNKEKRA